VTVEIEGQEKRVFHAGETFQFPAMVVHQTTAGPAGAKVLATWVHTPGGAIQCPGPAMRLSMGYRMGTRRLAEFLPQ
jgi:hypothetical protein